MIIVALLVFGGSSAALVAQRLRADPSTEFALLNQKGQAAFYPRVLGGPVTADSIGN